MLSESRIWLCLWVLGLSKYENNPKCSRHAGTRKSPTLARRAFRLETKSGAYAPDFTVFKSLKSCVFGTFRLFSVIMEVS